MTAPAPTPRTIAIAWAQQILTDPLAVILDTETTSLNDDAEIVDICIVGTDGRILLDSLCDPLQPIPPDATRIHGITDADVAPAPVWADLSCSVSTAIRGRRVVIWNGAFDVRVIRMLSEEYDLPQIPFTWICAMKKYGAFEGTPGYRAGVGSEVFDPVLLGRFGIGIELKDTYYRQLVRNVAAAVEERIQQQALPMFPEMAVAS